ncbi:hypothetical protein NBE98_09625 [Clostridium swellfunianum]|uniref:hypothetical protein n=1 Tax=Clostridium swellfunianum TaxID=1367462 RepID=UPI00203006C7|nr:hypothetical protein [Clostridium swellfunianum]MCM0648632.1 hypothetical protein [Clostridium swellfunianum]
MPNLEGKPIVNIKKVEITTEETIPKTYTWETASECEQSPDISEGEEAILRVKNTVYATDRTEDIVIGTTLTFKDNLFHPEVIEVIDGGTLVYDAVETTKATKYEPPVIGSPVIKKKFTLNIYTEEKDADGEVTGYVKFSYPHCKGKPFKASVKDGEFFAPEYTCVSRPKKGEKPYAIDFLTQLP